MRHPRYTWGTPAWGKWPKDRPRLYVFRRWARQRPRSSRRGTGWPWIRIGKEPSNLNPAENRRDSHLIKQSKIFQNQVIIDLWVMIDIERRLSQFNIPLVEGAHIGAMSLVVMYSIWFWLYRSPIAVGKEGFFPCSLYSYLPSRGLRRGSRETAPTL
jgi:hypothetical protein